VFAHVRRCLSRFAAMCGRSLGSCSQGGMFDSLVFWPSGVAVDLMRNCGGSRVARMLIS